MTDRLNAIKECHPQFPEGRKLRPRRRLTARRNPLSPCLKALRDSYNFDFSRTSRPLIILRPRPGLRWSITSTARSTIEYLRIVTPCPGTTSPRLPQRRRLWPTADWHERECWDMLGIRFEGHPDLRRILMWDELSLPSLAQGVSPRRQRGRVAIRRPHRAHRAVASSRPR
jgi:hypothetical protein